MLTQETILNKCNTKSLADVKNLNLWGSDIENIDILAQCPSLEKVSLSVNKISTLAPFQNLSHLQELYLRNNSISNIEDINFLKGCKNLKVLWLAENPISDIEGYRNKVIDMLPQLTKLDNIPIIKEDVTKPNEPETNPESQSKNEVVPETKTEAQNPQIPQVPENQVQQFLQQSPQNLVPQIQAPTSQSRPVVPPQIYPQMQQQQSVTPEPDLQKYPNIISSTPNMLSTNNLLDCTNTVDLDRKVDRILNSSHASKRPRNIDLGVGDPSVTNILKNYESSMQATINKKPNVSSLDEIKNFFASPYQQVQHQKNTPIKTPDLNMGIGMNGMNGVGIGMENMNLRDSLDEKNFENNNGGGYIKNTYIVNAVVNLIEELNLKELIHVKNHILRTLSK